MKKSLIKITVVTLGVVTVFSCQAQEADIKPKVADLSKLSEKERATHTDPAIAKEMAELKMITEAPKPIVPGGEFKPMDTNKPIDGIATEKYQPILIPQTKSAATPVLVPEYNAAQKTKDKAKPLPAKEILQKEQ
jgi:hypothetical protein